MIVKEPSREALEESLETEEDIIARLGTEEPVAVQDSRPQRADTSMPIIAGILVLVVIIVILYCTFQRKDQEDFTHVGPQGTNAQNGWALLEEGSPSSKDEVEKASAKEPMPPTPRSLTFKDGREKTDGKSNSGTNTCVALKY